MIRKGLVIQLVFVLFSSSAAAQAVYLEAEERVGFGEGIDVLDIFPDRSDGYSYILPRSMSNQNPRMAFFEIPLIDSTLQYLGNNHGLHEFRFLVIPDLESADVLDVLGVLAQQHRDSGEIVIPLDFESTRLELLGLPQGLLESADIFQITTEQKTDVMGYSFVIPPGYVYEVALSTRKPREMRSVIEENGLRGNAEFRFRGYRKMEEATQPPRLISLSIPVHVDF